ncbi:MAG: monofunctional biosynthetic peptidoglycan transglycosylase [Burkholderiaceae bacterium]
MTAGRLLGLGLLAAIAAGLLYLFGLFVMVLWLTVKNPGSSAFMNATLLELRAHDPDARLEYEWVAYEDISENLKRAVVASEDANFFEHTGVEWDAIRKAWEYNQRQAEKGNSRRRGGSTITQQLAKNLFLSNSRSYVRKAKELVITYMIELTMSKRRILELYLNVAQWGTHVFGAQAAAKHYYKTTAARLNTSQASRLAVMLPNPAFYDENGATGYLNSRAATIRRRMRLVDVPD